MSAVHGELRMEQAYIDRAYDELERIRSVARRLRDEALGIEAGGTHQSRFERDVIVQNAQRRLAQLDLGDRPLVFGRIDSPEERWYIGRVAVSAADHEPLVVDWRAPVSEAFYRATGHDPMGLVMRRHFASQGRRLVRISDERFGTGDDDQDLGLAGPGALVEVLGEARTGRMRDIVSTIQREQDEVIRDALEGILVVQGGPGTGKTAVALHRAAYLLFTHRAFLEGAMLVVAPSQLFLRYIEEVLPALGESGVALSTPEGLVEGVSVRGADPAHAAKVKGDVRMAKVLANAVRDRQRTLSRDAILRFGPHELRLTRRASATVIGAAKRRKGTHNRRRIHVEAGVVRHLYASYLEAERARHGHGSGGPERLGREEVAAGLRRHPEFRMILDRMWPVLSPAELLHDLLGSRPLLESAARGVLDDAERDALYRPHAERLRDVAWTPADMPLLDEVAPYLGSTEPTGDDEEDAEHPIGYRHIVVDEAQDLSPMQLRMLERRSLGGSMTLVGDLAQGTTQWAPRGWDDVLEHLPVRVPPRVRELTISYRTPREVMDLAARVLRAVLPGARSPEAVRETGVQPLVRHTPDVLSACGEVIGAELQAVGDGTIAVICSASHAPVVEAALQSVGIAFGVPDELGLHEQVTVIAVDMVKGLEFDSVIVVEPARIVEDSPAGLRALFVALTRPTRRLVILHADPLPGALRS